MNFCDLLFLKLLVLLLEFLSKFPPVELVDGCITVKTEYGKRSICSNLEKKFTKIPPDLPKGLKYLEINYQNIHSLTANQLKHIPLLIELNMDSNRLSSIDPDAFRYVPNLTNLTLKNNLLILGGNSFPSKALVYLQKLRSLNLQNNPLQFVPDFFFQQLKMLQRLYLSHALAGFHIKPNGLAGLTSLELLDLSFSYLTTLSGHKQLETALKNMQLQELYLFGNKWHCDCHLKWLKRWLANAQASGVDIILYKTYQRANGEEGVIQPRCSSPPEYKDRNIFRITTSVSTDQNPPYQREIGQTGRGNSRRYEHLSTDDLVCRPKIMSRSRHQTRVERGRNLTLFCEFEAEPSGRVEWSKNGMIVQQHWARVSWGQQAGGIASYDQDIDTNTAGAKQFSILPSGTGGERLDYRMRITAWLHITQVRTDDGGLWRCILGTTVGKANATFSVRVRQTSPPPIDLAIVLKYIGIGAVTLILLLVIIGIAIYCVYGFRLRGPFGGTAASGGKGTVGGGSGAGGHRRSGHQKSRRLITGSAANGTAAGVLTGTGTGSAMPATSSTYDYSGTHNSAVNIRNNIRPQLITAANIDKRHHHQDGGLVTDDSQKCLLLPSSPTMVFPIPNHHSHPNQHHQHHHHQQPQQQQQQQQQHHPCPLHGNNPPPHPHTLPRHHHAHRAQLPQQPPSIPQTPCPLHGHILASLQQQQPQQQSRMTDSVEADNDDNFNSVYSFFFSPRHSQPLINTATNPNATTIRIQPQTATVSQASQLQSPQDDNIGTAARMTSSTIIEPTVESGASASASASTSAGMVAGAASNNPHIPLPSSSSRNGVSNQTNVTCGSGSSNVKSHEDEGYSTSV